jgi:putative ABC transport system substrate-binding protein
MRRREFVAGLGGAVAWPLAAGAQRPTVPVIGFLDRRSPEALADRLHAFRQGLKDSDYVEGENVLVEYRWAQNQPDRLPALAAELTRVPVAVIVASGGTAVASAAKAATTTIPVVFLSPEDPVKLGLVASLARPGGNLTGINFFGTELTARRLELLREMVPAATRVAVLVNPANVTNTESTLRDVIPAARAIGVQINVLHTSSSREIDAAFTAFMRERPDALLVTGDSFLDSRRVHLAILATHYQLPAIYSGREYAEAGGLMSYGANIADAYHQVGIYTGRILKGEKPADLPVIQSVKLELVINLNTARALDLAVSPSLLARADEVIE